MTNCIRRLGTALFAAITLATTTVEAVDMVQRTEELKSLKWGMFVCWSFSTFSGQEWTPGITDISLFRATQVDTDQWARTAKEAGMGYILFLAKHHDGFCLWDTATTDRKVTEAPLGRDVLVELKQSCDRYGIKLAIYFSEGEWGWPNKPDGSRYENNGGYNPELKKAQLHELLTQFGPVEYIWFDHAVGDGGLSHVETIAFCKALQPGCFVGFNHGDQTNADIRLGERGSPGPLDPNQSHLLAEFTYPILPAHSGGADWFYSLPQHDNLCHPAEKLYADYLGAETYGNIFSIDVGPDYQGRLRNIDVQTLLEVGEMIKNPPTPPLSQNKPVQASSVWWQPGYEAAKAVDGDPTTRWAAADNSRSGWIEVDLQTEATVGRAEVKEISYPRTQEFAIEYKAGNSWIPVVTGGNLTSSMSYYFPPVTARFWRLNILRASEVPTIEEFRLFPPGPIPTGSIIWGTAKTNAADTDVSTAGALRYAYHWSSGDRTVNGVTFTGTTSVSAGGSDIGLSGFDAHFGGFTSTTTPFTGLSPAYQAMLAGSPYKDGVSGTVTLKNLTPGNHYAVQVWCQDPRSYGNGRTATLSNSGGNSVTLDYNSTNTNGGVGQYSIGTFTAATTTQTFTIGNNGSPMLNALQVRDLTTAYDAWANGTFVPALVSKLAADNPDGDSLNNLLEYAFATQPTVSTGEITYQLNGSVTPGIPKTFTDGITQSMVFGRRADHVAAGLSYQVQFSTALETWVDNDDTSNPPVQVATNGTIHAMRVPYPETIETPNGPRKPTFSRVKVKLPP